MEGDDVGSAERDARALIQRALQARREDRAGDAHHLAAAAVAACRQQGLRRPLVPALKALGQLARDEGRIEQAVARYSEAAALARTVSDPLELAHTIRHLGGIHREAGDLESAEVLLVEAVALYRAAPDARALDFANALRPLALLREAQGRLEEARRLWREARFAYDAVGVSAGVEEADEHLAALG